MAYKLKSGIDIFQQARSVAILKQATKEQWTYAKVHKTLAGEGLAYRRITEQTDYRRAQAISLSKNVWSEQRAEKFFEGMSEPFRKAHGLKSDDMTAIQNAAIGKGVIPDKLKDLLEDYKDKKEEYYEEVEW
ncbi:hypothetical protein ES707_07542 [subsurface metagenome]